MLELYWIEPLGLLSVHIFLGGPERVTNYSLAEWDAKYGDNPDLMRLKQMALDNPDRCIVYHVLPPTTANA